MKVALLSFADRRAETWAGILRNRPDTLLLAADDDPRRAAAVGARLGMPVANGWDAVFAERPDAVVIGGPPGRRRPLVERAAEVGAQVLCTQPLATTESDALAMADACARAGVHLTMAGAIRVSPAFVALRRAVADGELGTILAVHATGTDRPPGSWDATGWGGGALVYCAPDLVDLVDGMLNGEPAAQVYAQANGLLDPAAGVESAALLSVRYPSGPVATLACHWAPWCDGSGPVATVVGTKAEVEFAPRPRLLERYDTAAGGTQWEPGGADLDAGMLDQFLTGVRDDAPVGPGVDAGLRVLRVLLAAYRSVHTGQLVDLP